MFLLGSRIGKKDTLIRQLLAQSVTTTARSPAAATAVTHSHVAAYSSPAAVPPVDTATPPASHSSVTVSEYLTRPDLLSPPPQSTPTLLQVLQQHHSPPRPQQIPQQYLPIQHNHHQTPQPIFHQQVVQQVIPDQLLQPHNQTVYQLVRPTSQIPGSKPQQPYYVLQSLLVNVDEQPKTVSYSQSQRSPVEQTQVSPHSHTQQLSPNLQPSHTQLSPTLHSSHTQQLSPTLHPSQINHHQQLSPTLRPSHTQQQLSPTLQQRLSPEPVHVGQGSFSPKPASVSSYSPKPGQSTVNRQSALLKQLLIQNLIKGKLPNSIQQQTISHHHHKTAPCETVPYREYPDHSESLVEISVPERSPPPYHSIQRVAEAPALGGEKPAKDGGGLSPIIVGTSEPSIVPEKMESRLGSFDTFINTCGDMPYSTDFIDASIYASSPNSLFMYDQEKMDMQSTLASTSMCTSVEVPGLTDDFELKTQYEISQDLSNNLPVCVTSVDQCGGGVSVDLGYDGGSGSVGVGGQMWGNAVIKPAKEDVMIKSESTCSTSTPTLAELNFDQDLLEDIETVISVDMNSGTSTSAPRDSHPTIKQEPDLYTTMATSQSTQHPPQHTAPVYTKLVNAQTIPVTKVEVKTEPQEVAKAAVQNNNDEIAKILQSMSAKNWSKDNTTPKTLTPLTTIKQIDLSDARTLRHLLVDQRTAPPVKPQRKRTVSESATLKSATRKRGYPGGESMDKKWEEIKQFIHMETGGRGLEEETRSPVVAVRPPPVKRERRRNYSECSVATVTSNEDDESDSDRDLDDDSDSDLDDSHDISSLNPDESLIGEKDKQYFWQYNVQSKGPKGTRAHFDMEDDPHVLNDFEDPVFDPTNSNLAGVGISIKHGGKARKGDGNDIVPSPKKLCQIGLQLRRINRQINDFMPVSELPSGARNKTRKEKNKLASRACRLKKKAQHEANKVKLHGLETEHRQLLTVIRVMRQRLMERLRAGNVKQEEQATMTETLEGLMKQYLSTMIGGNTTDYVNKIVHKVEAGDLTGGINIKATAPRSYPKELHN